jgi:hypothetical protein
MRHLWTIALACLATTSLAAAATDPDVDATAWPREVVTIAATRDGAGLHLGFANGEVQGTGTAATFGDARSLPLNSPIVAMASTATSNGYWLLAADGGVFSYGDAQFFGSTGSLRLNEPVVGMASTAANRGYWLVASDGGIFAFGDAAFIGSIPGVLPAGVRLNAPIVGMVPSVTGRGYLLVAADGGVFAFGDAAFLGSTGAAPPSSPIVDLSVTSSGRGYLLVTAAGDVIAFGDAVDHGDASVPPGRRVAGIALSPLVGATGYAIALDDGTVQSFGPSPPGPPPSSGPNAAIGGALTTPSPTLRNIAIEWDVAGDANANAVVNVRFRAAGTPTWVDAMPLRRITGGSNEGFTWRSRHSGSIFDLTPGTSYEVSVSLVDPDGGSQTRNLTVATRPVPVAASDSPVRAATPATLASVLATYQPGDVVELAAGTYGGFTLPRGGLVDRPTVIRGLPGAVVNGEIGLFDRDWVRIEGLTVNGRIRFNLSDNVTIVRNVVNAQTSVGGGDGIVTLLRSENAYIADNVVTGTTSWTEGALGASGANLGEGIAVTGPGHVIEHNRVRGFRDGISLLEDSGAVDQWSIDIANNDIFESADDAVEADFCFHNCRITRNRVTNAFVAFSSQPSLGGPTWFVRNTAYNVVHVAFKLYRGSIGDVVLHNTIVKNGDALGAYPGRPISGALFRNNVFIGGAGGTYNGFSSGTGRVASLDTLDVATSSLDFDAYGSTTGAFTGRIGSASFTSLAQLRSLTSEADAIAVDMSMFATGVAFPSSPLTAYGTVDLRPSVSSAVAGAAQPLPNINGASPDIGAHEAGEALPVYGPRS